MKRILPALGLLAASLYATDSQAEERWPRWYVGINGMLTTHEDSDQGTTGYSFDDNFGVSAALGYQIPAASGPFAHMRVEGEVAYFANDIDTVSIGGVSSTSSGEIENTAYMLNAYFDIPTGWAVMPYLGAGIGLADAQLSNGTTNDDDQVLAYQFMAGLGYTPQTIPMTQWTIGYRYFATEDVSLAAGDVKDNVIHNMEAGVKLRF